MVADQRGDGHFVQVVCVDDSFCWAKPGGAHPELVPERRTLAGQSARLEREGFYQ